MRILITNDDGYDAPGIEVLERIARTISDDIWVVAPLTDQSGIGHGLTMNDPLRLRKIDETHYALNGTPADCVIMAVKKLMDKEPDLILSGVNAGHNIGQYVTYSGTVAGALEGTIMGIRSIALSQGYNYDADVKSMFWDVVEDHAPALLKKLITMDLPEDTFLNLNFPNCHSNEVKGVRATEQGRFDHSLSMTEHVDGRGKPYFWLSFMRGEDREHTMSDIDALKQDYISVTPLKLDLTDHGVVGSIEAVLAQE